jgi:hypothetical protein
MHYIQSLLIAIAIAEAAIGAPVQQDPPKSCFPKDGGPPPYRCDLDRRSVDVEKRQFGGYDYNARPDSPTLGGRLAKRQFGGYDYTARPDSPTLGGRLAKRQFGGYDYNARPDSPTLGHRLTKRGEAYDYNARPDSPTKGGSQ